MSGMERSIETIFKERQYNPDIFCNCDENAFVNLSAQRKKEGQAALPDSSGVGGREVSSCSSCMGAENPFRIVDTNAL